jgi:hypothetical protein
MPDPTAYFRQRSRPFTGTPRHTFLGWSINLEAPFVRHVLGVDTTDAGLDVSVAPHGGMQWRNIELFPALVDVGIYGQGDLDDFLEAGREAIALVEARRFPFDGSYLDWLPPDSWPVPQAASGWERVPGYDVNLSTGVAVPGARV